jgi:hypothetical protein
MALKFVVNVTWDNLQENHNKSLYNNNNNNNYYYYYY